MSGDTSFALGYTLEHATAIADTVALLILDV
jgi:hypothetical protein